MLELNKLKSKIEQEKTREVKNEWETELCIAFHKDSGLFLDSEVFEIMGVKTKEDVLKLIDMLLTKVE